MVKESQSVEKLRQKTREVKQKIDEVLNANNTKSSKVQSEEKDKHRSYSLTNEKNRRSTSTSSRKKSVTERSHHAVSNLKSSRASSLVSSKVSHRSTNLEHSIAYLNQEK